MIFLAIFILLSALIIAGCAAYFSIVGLTLLFVGANLSIIVMGSALELGKLVTVSFLHQQWEKINLLLKTYLILASIVLSAITSVGIYGYLANGYNTTSLKVYSIEQEVDYNNKLIEQYKAEISKLLQEPVTVKVADNTEKFVEQQIALINQKISRINELQKSIELEQAKNSKELATAKSNIEQETNKELEQIKLYNDRLGILDKEVQVWMDQGTGGLFKQNGLQKARETRLAQEKERNQIDLQIKDKQNNIDKIRINYDAKVKSLSDDLAKRISTIEGRITEIELEITKDKQAITDYKEKVINDLRERDKQRENKFEENRAKAETLSKTIQVIEKQNTELQSRIIQTDVGTFKFVAKSIGVELDKTVNWFIWSIMFVFDPLAVTLIICFNHLLKHRKQLIKPANVCTTSTSVPAVSAPSVLLVSPTSAVTADIQETNSNTYGTFDKDGFFNTGPGHIKVPGH